jgi:hypothetical protein
MPDRVVKLALASYVDDNGLPRYGLQGETVTVHPDHVDRFDEFNVDMGPPFDPQREPVDLVAGGGGERPAPRVRKRA